MIGQLNNLNNEGKTEFQKIGWRGCCALMAFFIVTFTITFFSLTIWHYYKQIEDVDLAATIWDNKNIETVDRKIVETKDDPFWGSPDAKIVIVEFCDFECPFCQKMIPILRELNLKYPKEIKFIYRDFLGHINSQKSAEAAQCANEQEAFLAYHDKLFLNQDSLDINSLKIYARQISIKDTNQFDDCLDNDKFELEVQQDHKESEKLGVTGTPTFFINGIKIKGARPGVFFEQIIKHLLNKK